MSYQTCPTDVIEAAPDKIWQLLIEPGRLADWVDARLLRGPSRALEVGDRLVFGAGPGHRMRVVMQVLALHQPEQLELHIQLPFGLVNHELIQVHAIAPSRCRVTLN